MKRFIFVMVLMSFSIDSYAVSSYLTLFNNKYGTSATTLNSCFVCHAANASGGRSNNRNSYGAAWDSAGGNTAAFATIEPLDSDADGFTNIVEITARTFPGSAASFPIAVKIPNAPTNLIVVPVL